MRNCARPIIIVRWGHVSACANINLYKLKKTGFWRLLNQWGYLLTAQVAFLSQGNAQVAVSPAKVVSQKC